MRNFFKISVIILLLVGGCATGGGINSWVGQPESALVSQLGYPMQKNRVGDNAYVYIYQSGVPTFNNYFTVANGKVTQARVKYEGGL